MGNKGVLPAGSVLIRRSIEGMAWTLLRPLPGESTQVPQLLLQWCLPDGMYCELTKPISSHT